jgi:Ala-tRNA(Pro) deacylase
METGVTRLLDREGVAYRKVVHAEPALSVEDVVRETGLAAGQILKAMVLIGKGGELVIALMPGDRRLDVGAVSRTTGLKLTLMRPEKIEAATGYPLGAVSPLLMPPGVRVVIDAGVDRYERVNVSAGHPRVSVELRLHDLRRLIATG